MMVDVDEVEVVVAHQERATLRVGDVFLKIDADETRIDVEVEAMALAPIPTPEVPVTRLEPGDTAPEFTLPTDDDREVSLRDLRGTGSSCTSTRRR